MKKLTREQMRKIRGGDETLPPSTECAADCNPGFVSIDDCTGTCTATEDEGVKCGSKKQCCPGFAC